MFHALIERLNGEGIPIAVDDQSREKIRFGVNQPVRGGVGDDLFAERLRGGDSGCDVDRAGRAAEHPQRNLRCGAVVGLSEELAARVEYADDRSRRGFSC